MHGVVSVLDELHYGRVEALWDLLEEECGLAAIREVPIPHFSWQIAEDYDFEGLQRELQTLANEMGPFEVTTSGLGIFAGAQPVVYVQVTKNPNLMTFHQRMWRLTRVHAAGLSQFYSPEAWMPHITLANKDVDPGSLACAMRCLGMLHLNWRMQVDNFAVVVHEEGQVGSIHSKYRFTQNEGDK